MSEKPKISVLVPIYNVERYLNECLESLQEQSFKNFEVICLNDGSTDGSREIIQRFVQRDSRFVLVDKPNSGYGASMNIGLEHAKGDFISILESDDKMLPGALEKLYLTQQKYDAEVVKGDYILYWSDSEKQNKTRRMFDESISDRLTDARAFEYIYLQEASIWSALYCRDFLKKHEIRFLETPGASYQDTSFAFKVWACAQRAVFIQDPIIAYRQDNENSSVNSKEKAFFVCGEYKEIFRWLERYEPRELKNEVVKLALISKYNAYLWNLDRLAVQNKLSFLENMRSEFLEDKDSGLMKMEDWTYWRRLNLEVIFENPKKYLQIRNSCSDRDTLSKVKFAYRLGGLKAVIMAIKNRKVPR